MADSARSWWEQCADKWIGLFTPAVKAVLTQVHPKLSMSEDAAAFMDSRMFHLFAHICACTDDSFPASTAECESAVRSFFPDDSTELANWAISEASDAVESFIQAKKKSSAISTEFPVMKAHERLCKDVVRATSKGAKVDTTVTLHLMAILDYIAADVLKLVGNFVNLCANSVVQVTDIKTAVNGDKALSELWVLLESLPAGRTESQDDTEMTYEGAIKEMMSIEGQYLHELDIVTKVFLDLFESRPDIFAPDTVHYIFSTFKSISDVTHGFYSLLEDCIELSAARSDIPYPAIGSCFYSFILDGELCVYADYAESIETTMTMATTLSDDMSATFYLRSLGLDLTLVDELPRLLLEPLYHIHHYIALVDVLWQRAPASEAVEASKLKQALSALKSVEVAVSPAKLSRYLEKRTTYLKFADTSSVIKRTMHGHQRNIGDWFGPNLADESSRVLRQGDVVIWHEKMKKLSERHVLVLDGGVLCCKAAAEKKGHALRLKERFDTRCLVVEPVDDIMRFGVTSHGKVLAKTASTSSTGSLSTRTSSTGDGGGDDGSGGKVALRLRRTDGDASDSILLLFSSVETRRQWWAALARPQLLQTLEATLTAKEAEYEKDLPLLMPSATTYVFAEPDGPSNLRLEENQNVANSDYNLRMYGEKHPDTVKGGTLVKLVERLTFVDYADPMYVRHFLITFRSFTTPDALLDLLILRYKVPTPRSSAADAAKVKLFARKIAGPIRSRVINVIKHWLEHHYEDFRANAVLLRKLLTFVKEELKPDPAMKSAVSLLTKTIKKQREACDGAARVRGQYSPGDAHAHAGDPPPMVLWPNQNFEDEPLHVLTLHPIEVARQMTIMEFELYRAVEAGELSGLAWTKDNKYDRAENVLRLIHRSNDVTNWVIRSILELSNVGERADAIAMFLEIMRELQALQNFNGVMEVLSGLQNSAISRLKLTWAEVGGRRRRVLETCGALMASDKSFATLRDTLASVDPPCLPFFGMYLSDLTFIEQGSPDFLPVDEGANGKSKDTALSQLINFGKRRLSAKTIVEIQQNQVQPYNLTVDAKIRTFLLDMPALAPCTLALPPAEASKADAEAFQEAAYNLSLALEPRGVTDKQELPKHDPVFVQSAKVRVNVFAAAAKHGARADRRTASVLGARGGRVGSAIGGPAGGDADRRSRTASITSTGSVSVGGDRRGSTSSMMSVSRRTSGMDRLSQSRRSVAIDEATRNISAPAAPPPARDVRASVGSSHSHQQQQSADTTGGVSRVPVNAPAHGMRSGSEDGGVDVPGGRDSFEDPLPTRTREPPRSMSLGQMRRPSPRPPAPLPVTAEAEGSTSATGVAPPRPPKHTGPRPAAPLPPPAQ